MLSRKCTPGLPGPLDNFVLLMLYVVCLPGALRSRMNPLGKSWCPSCIALSGFSGARETWRS